MKKILVVLFASLFSLGFIAQNAMAVTPKEEEMVIGVFIGSEPVPPIPLTAKDIKTIVAAERQRTVKSVKKLLDAKDTQTAAELKANNWAIDNLVGVNRGVTVALDNLDRNVKRMSSQLDNTSTVTKKVGGEVNNTKWLLVGVMCVGLVILALLILRNGSSIHAVGTTLDRVETKVDETPDKTADAVLSPWDFDINGHTVTWRPASLTSIQEIHVPRGASGDLASFVRNTESREGIARRNFRKTMRLYLERKFNAPEYALQKQLIDRLVETGEIKIS